MSSTLRVKFVALLLTVAVTGCTSTPDPSVKPDIDTTTTQPDVPTIDPDVPSGPRLPLILVGIDGFKPEYMERVDTPHLDGLVAQGVLADSMIPVFPSKTFPNLYSIVTGLYPENTGIVSNTVYDAEIGGTLTMHDPDAVSDSRWWGGEPIWVTAEKAGLRTGTLFWVGSEAPIKGLQPTHWRPYDFRISHTERVDSVVEWMSRDDDQRAQFATLYFSTPDSRGHTLGPGHSNMAETIASMDEIIGYLIERLTEAGLWPNVNLMIVSDHGMTAMSRDKVIFLDDIISLSEVNIIDWTPVAMLNARFNLTSNIYEQLKAAEENYKVYLKEDLPERYRIKNNDRVPEIVIVADLPYTITSHAFHDRDAGGTGNRGNHGYDPQEPDMHAFFLAHGPNFKQGVTVEPFELIHLYELMTSLLHLEAAPNDGDFSVVRPMLR